MTGQYDDAPAVFRDVVAFLRSLREHVARVDASRIDLAVAAELSNSLESEARLIERYIDCGQIGIMPSYATDDATYTWMRRIIEQTLVGAEKIGMKDALMEAQECLETIDDICVERLRGRVEDERDKNGTRTGQERDKNGTETGQKRDTNGSCHGW